MQQENKIRIEEAESVFDPPSNKDEILKRL